MTSDEILTKIIVPGHSAHTKGKYRKLKRINGHDLGIIGVAVAIVDGGLRIAVSSAAPTPVVTGPLPLDISAEDATAAVMGMVAPISDVRCTKEYREFMIGAYTRRLLAEVRG